MSATSGNGVVGSHGFDLSAETSSLPQPGLATRGLHSDDVRAGWGDEGRYHCTLCNLPSLPKELY